MRCPRLEHFVRFNPNGTVSRCGHMIAPAQFDTLDAMDSSKWLEVTKDLMAKDVWPTECRRCEQTEKVNGTSIRLNSINFDSTQTMSDYLIVGGVLDNICNSGCLTCNENLSTKIGSLKSKDYLMVNNTNRFWKLPLDRIVHLDLNGGEPSASKNYKQVLDFLPKNVKSVRLNTNCSRVLTELDSLIDRGVHVTVTVSLDGIGGIHDYIRWPIKWDNFYNNLMKYKSMNLAELNTWTTVSALNIGNFEEITAFVKEHNLLHSWAFLNSPDVLNVKYKNTFTEPYSHLFPENVAVDRNNQTEIDAFLKEQHKLRNVV